MEIRETSAGDTDSVFALYQRVAETPGGLIRLASEVTPDYVTGFLERASTAGLSLLAFNGDQLIGEIHAYSPQLFALSHVWSELSIAVHPDAQGRGVGRALFVDFMRRVRERPEIDRVELIARESNQRAIEFYESLGFQREGRFDRRIRNVDHSVEADIPMAWLRP
ncbi:MAG: GNAT family N-acetyltransferase [Pseudomonadota bacterium]